MADVRIRRAGEQDAYVIAALNVQFARDLGLPSEPGYLERFAAVWLAERPDRPTWIAESRGQHAGLLSARRLRPLPFPSRAEVSWLYVGNLFVGPDHRKRGIGRALIEGMLDWCRSTDVRTVRINADPATHEFYRRLGFTRPGTILEYDLRAGG